LKPTLPQRACSEPMCGGIAVIGSSRCEAHTRNIRTASQRIYDDCRGSRIERGYDEHDDKLRVLCFQRDEWRCRGCAWEPPIVEQFRLAGLGELPVDAVLDELRRAKVAGERHLHADHVVPIEGRNDPRRLDLDNMQTLCDTCHRRKTMKENGLRAVPGMVLQGPDR
jgi:5-methylcytosine-specific restriction endonuclease McrA